MAFLDLIQEGTLGLVRAAEKFNGLPQGLQLSTYATWWNCQAVARAIANKGRTIRMQPVHVVEKLNKINRAERKLVGELGREPTIPEIAEAVKLPAAEVGSIKRSAQTPVSLEKPVGDDEESEFGQFLADEKAVAPESAAEMVLRNEARGMSSTVLTTQSARLELALRPRGRCPRTFDEACRRCLMSPASGSARSRTSRCRSWPASPRPSGCARWLKVSTAGAAASPAFGGAAALGRGWLPPVLDGR